MNDVTRKILSSLPQWMKLKTDEASVGAQFLEVFGLEFSEIESYLEEQLNANYISTASLDELDWIYKTSSLPIKLADIITVTGDGESLTECLTLLEFYAEEDTDLFLVDYIKKIIYYRNSYENLSVSINGVPFTVAQEVHHIWNIFDEFALLLGLSRIYMESNKNLKVRILDVFRRPGNTAELGLKNGIARALGISPSHVQLDTLMQQSAFSSSLLTESGAPTQRFLNIIRSLNSRASAIWEYAVWDITYWQAMDEDLIGLDYLPRLWALQQEGIAEALYQSGIGDNDDCKIEILEAQDNVQDFNYYITAQGVENVEDIVYPPHKFNYEVYAEGVIPKMSSIPEEYYYTVEAAEIMPITATVNAYDDTDRFHEEDFSDISTYTVDGLESVPSNQLQNNRDRYMRLIVNMKSSDGMSTPVLRSIGYDYVDADGAPKTVNINTLSDFTTPSDLVMQNNVSVSPDGTLQLFMGSFNYRVGEGSTITWESYKEGSNFLTIGDTIKMKGI